MGEKILLVAHSASREGRVAPLLEAKGYGVEWRCPAKGDHLPAETRDYAGVIVLGGPQSVNDAPTVPYLQHEIDWIAHYVESGRPYLGICLGGQLLARALDARVARHPESVNEIGYYRIAPTPAGAADFDGPLHVYHWHQEGFEVPHGAELLAVGESFPNQAFRYGAHAYGLQFHPEVTAGVLRRWLDTAADHLVRPGAQPRDMQLADCPRFDPPMHVWLDGFLDRWLGRAGDPRRLGKAGRQAPIRAVA